MVHTNINNNAISTNVGGMNRDIIVILCLQASASAYFTSQKFNKY